MSDSERDDELENFLRRRSPMHRRLSDFDHAEPSIELDRVVLNRAREAIETPKQPQMFRGSRWAMPAGLAATILIAFTLVLNVEHQPRKVVASAQSQGAASVVGQAGSVPAELAVAPAAPASRQEKAVADAAADTDTGTAARSETPLVASNSAIPPQVASTAPAAAESKAEVRADAESWLREIARLRAEGKNADADREVVAFRRAYPSHAGTSLAQPPTR